MRIQPCATVGSVSPGMLYWQFMKVSVREKQLSQSDREKWNQRYREGAYAERVHPAAFLAEQVPGICALQEETATQPPRALDLACGAGRNAFYLAESGYLVDAIDVSAEALARARGSDRAAAQRIQWIEHDLDHGLPPDLPLYDLAIIIRYLDIDLARLAACQLRPGGILVCEAHLITDQEVAGPSGAAFRARVGQLREAAEGLELVSYWEGITRDPDDQPVALARLVARRPFQGA